MERDPGYAFADSPPDSANTTLHDGQDDVNLERGDTIKALESNLNWFAGTCIPDIFVYLFPALFIAIWDILVSSAKQSEGFLRLVIGLPRGFAKTLFLKIYCIYIILFTNRNFILIVCNTEALALNFIADVMDILSSPNIRAIFGDWRLGMEKDTQAWKKFGFRGRDIIIAGLGVGSSLRGISLKFRRPDVIICDDMQSYEDAEQSIVANKQLIWLMGTLLKARNYKRCVVIYVGNMYPFEGCILAKLKDNTQWISFVCGGILADGSSLWEELRPLESLLDELESDVALGHPEVFYAEVMNDLEAGTVSGVDVSKIPPYPPSLDLVEPQGGFIIIDPASGKKTGNDVAIAAFYIYDGTPVMRKILHKPFSASQTIQEALMMAMNMGIRVIGVESQAYQYTLIHWFEWFCNQLNIQGMHFVEIYSGAYSKNSRIKEMLNGLIRTKISEKKKDEIILHPEVKSTVVHQIVHWNPLRKNNTDDLLDILAYVRKMIDLYGNLMELLGSVDIRGDLSPPAAHAEELALGF